MAQSGKVWQRMVKVPANDHSLLQVLSVIEKQTGVTFNYDRTILNVQQPVKGGLQGRLLWMGCLFMNNR
jgi:hypothetical protein